MPGAVGSTAGHVIVGGGILWMSAAMYATFMVLRWLAARCYEHYLRSRLFAACTDPAEARPARCRSPRHRMPFNSRNKGSKCVSMTWREHFHTSRHRMPFNSLKEGLKRVSMSWRAMFHTSRHRMTFKLKKSGFEMGVGDVKGNSVL